MGLLEMLGKMIPMPNMPDPGAAKSKKESIEKYEGFWAVDTRRRKPHEKQWQLNMAMVMGNQWVGLGNGQIVKTLEAPSWRVMNVDNKIFVRVRSKMTRLLGEMTPTAIPASSENIDVRRAEYKERLLRHLRRETNDNLLRFLAAQWLVTCGEVYTEVFWDESAGDTYAADGGAFSEGEVGVKIWDPFAVWPGAGCSAGNNGGRLTTVQHIHVELARLKYNNDKISPDSTDYSDVKMRAAMENFFSANIRGTSSSDQNSGFEDMVQVRTVREYRTKANPLGRISTIIGKEVIEQKDLAWDGITHICNYPNYSGYHGDAVEVRNSIQQQKSFNRLRSHAEEYVKTCQKGKILKSTNTKISKAAFDSEHFEIIEYAGPAPEWMKLNPLPNDYANLMALCVTSIDDAFSDHLASQGQAPASASGSAINYLTEEDSRQHGPSRNLWTDGWARTYEKELDVVAGKDSETVDPTTREIIKGKSGYKADRTITILGESRRADIQRLDPEMIAGRNRIYIALGGALPENKVLRAEVARRWLVDGVFGDPASKEARRGFLKMVGGGLDADINSTETLDEIRAEWENNQLKEGNPVPPRPEDDHAVHSRVIGRQMKTDEFLQYAPEIQDWFYDHKAIHDTLIGLAVMPSPNAPQVPNGPDNSPAAANPVDMLKSVQQSAAPPPAEGAPGPETPLE